VLGLTSPRFDRGSHDQRGLVSSSALALLGAGVVLAAGAVYLATTPAPEPQQSVELTAAPPPQPVAPSVRIEKKPRPAPVVRRSDTYVVVFNNSGVTGLAGATAARLSGAGWKVVGSDNWYGTIPENTVYFPERLRAQGRLLAKDLGIARVRPSIDPMQMDRLTVILTGALG
jgi:hypothetical protein